MSSLFGAKPDDVDLSDNRTPGDNAAVIILVAVATTAVVLRLIARRIQQLPLYLDDYLIMVALVFVYGTAGLSIAGGFFYAGKHVWLVTVPALVTIVKILFAYTWIYGICVSTTKLSILSFYYRIFATPTGNIFKMAIFFCSFMTASYPIVVICTMLAACRPLHYYWDQYQDANLKGTCIKVNLFFLIAGIINMVNDVLILSLPIPKIYQLEMPRSRKLSVIGIMLLGSFVCVASVVRIYYLVVLQTAIDLTWIMGPVFIWSSVEPAVGILSACLPLMRPLLRVFFPHFLSSNKRSTSQGLRSSHNWANTHNTHKSVDRHDFDHMGAYMDRTEEDEIQLMNQASAGNRSTSSKDTDLKGIPLTSIVVKTDVEQSSSRKN